MIIPQPPKKQRVNDIEWLDFDKVKKSYSQEISTRENNMSKIASAQPKAVVSQYGCSCGKSWLADNPAFSSQITMAKAAGKQSVDLSCPSCGNFVFPLNTVGNLNSNKEVRSEASFVGGDTNLRTSASTYNTFIDKHVINKGIDALRRYAGSMGMSLPVVHYLRGEHSKKAGFELPIITTFSSEIEWTYGNRQKMRVTANVEIDAAGKIKMPKVFKTADFKEHPFEKDYILAMQKNIAPKLMVDQSKKTDIQRHRKADPTRFRSYASSGDTGASAAIEDKLRSQLDPAEMEKAWMSALDFVKSEGGPDDNGNDAVDVYYEDNQNNPKTLINYDDFGQDEIDAVDEIFYTKFLSPIIRKYRGGRRQVSNLEDGIKHETEEHGESVPETIAKDHLKEDPKYYEHLEEMEKDAALKAVMDVPYSTTSFRKKELTSGVKTKFDLFKDTLITKYHLDSKVIRPINSLYELVETAYNEYEIYGSDSLDLACSFIGASDYGELRDNAFGDNDEATMAYMDKLLKVPSNQLQTKEDENYSYSDLDRNNNMRYYNKSNQLHRLDGPAIIYDYGDKFWYINGKRYSEEDYPAAVEAYKANQSTASLKKKN